MSQGIFYSLDTASAEIQYTPNPLCNYGPRYILFPVYRVGPGTVYLSTYSHGPVIASIKLFKLSHTSSMGFIKIPRKPMYFNTSERAVPIFLRILGTSMDENV
jgi:hypothetical protein